MTVSDDPPFVTGAWRDGDPVGHRAFVDFPELHLERGGVLPSVRVAYETWGTLNPAGSNAILVEHALTGDSHVVGAAGPGHASPGWWEGLVGPGRDIDTDATDLKTYYADADGDGSGDPSVTSLALSLIHI